MVYNNNEINGLPILVVDCSAAPIIGRNWFDKLGIAVKGVYKLPGSSSVMDIIKKYEEVFDEALGKYSGPPVKLELKDQDRSLSNLEM